MTISNSKDKPSFTPFITSEGLINNHIQIRQSKGLSNANKLEKVIAIKKNIYIY